MAEAPRLPYVHTIPTMRDGSEPNNFASAPAFAAHTHVIGSAVLVRLCGDFTELEAATVEEIFDRAADLRPDLVIDMRSTRHIDPAGMHIMTDHHQRRIEKDARMYVAAPSPSCAALIADLPLSVFDHADAALLALASRR